MTPGLPSRSSAERASGCAAPYKAGPVNVPSSSFPGKLADVLVADMDGDGNPDIVFANGNDTSKGDVHVLYGPFHGRASASWSSNASDYYRRLAIGDVNNDGFLDIAVAVEPGLTAGPLDCTSRPASPLPVVPHHEHFSLDAAPSHGSNVNCDGETILGSTNPPEVDAILAPWHGENRPIAVAIFLNRGSGEPRDFGSTPSQAFTYQIPANASAQDKSALAAAPLGAVSVDFGDYDGDGWLDIAVAGGSIARHYSVPVQTLKNDHGTFLPSPKGWRSTARFLTYSVRFLDWNGDGLIDLLATTQIGKQWGLLFEGQLKPGKSPTLSTKPAKTDFSFATKCALVVATDALTAPDGSHVVIAAAVNGKAAAATGGLEGPGVILQGPGGAKTVPISPSLVSGVRFVDLDGDRLTDLLAPNWNSSTSTAEEAVAGPILCAGSALAGDTVLETALQNLTGASSFSQGIGVGDVDRAARFKTQTAPMSCINSKARRYVIPIVEPNIENVDSVTVNGSLLSVGQYASTPNGRVIYITGGLSCSQTAVATVEYTRSPDVIVGDFSDCGAPLKLLLHN